MPGHEDATLNSDDHYWDVWHGRGDWSYYREYDTRFSSEFGFASSCTPTTWNLVSRTLSHHEDPVVRWHDKTNKPWPVFRDMVELHYPPSTNLDEWVYASQMNQRDALRAAFEHYRLNPACRGALIWQANDCWPVQSWAIEDFARLLKPAGFEMARLLAPVLVATRVEDGVLTASVCNDSQTRLDTHLTVTFVDTLTGSVLRQERVPLNVPIYGRSEVATLSLGGLDPKQTAYRVTTDDGSAGPRWGLLDEPKNTRFGSVAVEASVDAGQIIVTPRGFVFDLTVSAEVPLTAPNGLAGTVAVTLLPGERFVLSLVGTPGRLVARSLEGSHEVVVVPSRDMARLS